jgi:transposase
MTCTEMARQMNGVSVSCIQLWARTRRLKTKRNPKSNRKRGRTIDDNYAAAIIEAWQDSCTFVEVAKILSSMVGRKVSEHWVRFAVGDEMRMRVLGLQRVVRSALPELKERWLRAQKDVFHPRKRGLARYSRKKIKQLSMRGAAKGGSVSGSSVESRVRSLSKGDFFIKLAKPLPIIREQTVRIKRAASLLGVSDTTISRWMGSGQLKWKYSHNDRVVFVSSIQHQRSRLKKKFPKLAKAA